MPQGDKGQKWSNFCAKVATKVKSVMALYQNIRVMWSTVNVESAWFG